MCGGPSAAGPSLQCAICITACMPSMNTESAVNFMRCSHTKCIRYIIALDAMEALFEEKFGIGMAIINIDKIQLNKTTV